MSSDDYLLPPSAFLVDSQNTNRYVECEYDNNLLNPPQFYSCERSSQTQNPKLISVGISTDFSISELEEVKGLLCGKEKQYYDANKVDLDRLNCERNESLDEVEVLRSKLTLADDRNVVLTEDLERMKLYISGVANREEWVREKKKLMKENDQLHDARVELEDCLESGRIQQANLEQILRLQERELDKSVAQTVGKRRGGLLEVWRHKVLSLMVQREAGAIATARDTQRMKQRLQLVEDKAIELSDEKERLSLKQDNLSQQLSDCRRLVEKLGRENAELGVELDECHREREGTRTQLLALAERVAGFLSDPGGSSGPLARCEAALTRLSQLERRLEYGVSRLPVIQASLARQRHLSSATPASASTHGSSNPPTDKIQQLEEALVLTRKEVDNLRGERDKLCSVIEEDSRTFHERLQQKKDGLDEEIQQLHSRIKQQEVEATKSRKEKQLTEQENERLRRDVDRVTGERARECDGLRSELSRSRNELSRVRLDLSQYKRGVDQAAERHKAQLEELARERERLDSQWREVSTQLRAECDLLKTAMRQQGIVSQLQQCGLSLPSAPVATTAAAACTRKSQEPTSTLCSSRDPDGDVDNLMREIEDLSKDLDKRND